MRRYFLPLVFLLLAHLPLHADTLDDFLVASEDQVMTPSVPGPATDITPYLSGVTDSPDSSEPVFQSISLPLTFEEFMMLEGTTSTTDQETAGSDKLSIPQAIRAVPEISTFLLVVTGVFGACVLACRRRLVQLS